MARLKADPALAKPVTDLRNAIRDIGRQVRQLMNQDGPIKTVPPEHRPEAFANAMLSFRCLEDARMRMGKLLQAAEGGESIYDRPPEESVGEIQPT